MYEGTGGRDTQKHKNYGDFRVLEPSTLGSRYATGSGEGLLIPFLP